MVNISYLTLLSPTEMLSSTAVTHLFIIISILSMQNSKYSYSKVALSWADKSFGKYSVIILVAVFISNYGTCLVLFLCNTRITYAAARDSMLPKILSMLNVDNLTPTPSILITGIISLFMIL